MVLQDEDALAHHHVKVCFMFRKVSLRVYFIKEGFPLLRNVSIKVGFLLRNGSLKVCFMLRNGFLEVGFMLRNGFLKVCFMLRMVLLRIVLFRNGSLRFV